MSRDDQPAGGRNRSAGAPTNRRGFFKRSIVVAGASLVPSLACVAGGARAPGALVDVNVTLGRWPTRRMPLDETERLVAKLRAHGVGRAWAGGFEALIHKDLAGANARLARECAARGRGLLVPFGSVNPALPGWERDLERCAGEHRMPGIRLHPNYHGYKLEDPAFVRLLRAAAERSLIVQVALLMEDERMMHSSWRLPVVESASLPGILGSLPGLRLIVLNGLGVVRGEALRRLAGCGDVSFDIATLEGVGGIERALEVLPADRLLFGSHAPCFYFEAAALKLRESSLQEEPADAIRWRNAARLLPRGR